MTDVDYKWFQTHAYCFLQHWWPSSLPPAACMHYPKPYISSTDIHCSPNHQVCLVDRTGDDGDRRRGGGGNHCECLHTAYPHAAMQLHGRNSYLLGRLRWCCELEEGRHCLVDVGLIWFHSIHADADFENFKTKKNGKWKQEQKGR